VHRRLVDAGLLRRFSVELGRTLDAVPDPAAIRDVARRVLVEERVEEDVPDLTDARAAVDERDLAELRRSVVRGELGADVVGAGRRLDVDCAAVFERQLEVADDVAASSNGPCPRRAASSGS
jgi:hypothetical protein